MHIGQNSENFGPILLGYRVNASLIESQFVMLQKQLDQPSYP